MHSNRWQGLSIGARALLIEIWSWHNGSNNGAIRYGITNAVDSLHCSRSTAIRWFKELESARLIEATERGAFRWKAGARRPNHRMAHHPADEGGKEMMPTHRTKHGYSGDTFDPVHRYSGETFGPKLSPRYRSDRYYPVPFLERSYQAKAVASPFATPCRRARRRRKKE